MAGRFQAISADSRSLFILGTALWALVFFAREEDLAGCLVLALTILLETKMAWYLPAVGAYLAGKALYTGGKKGCVEFKRCHRREVWAITDDQGHPCGNKCRCSCPGALGAAMVLCSIVIAWLCNFPA